MGEIDTIPRLQGQPQNRIAPNPPCMETCMSKLPYKKLVSIYFTVLLDAINTSDVLDLLGTPSKLPDSHGS